MTIKWPSILESSNVTIRVCGWNLEPGLDVFAGEDFAEGKSRCSVGVGGLWGAGGWFSLSSEEEEGGGRMEVSKESHFCQRLLCYGMSKNTRLEQQTPRIW